MNSNYNKFLKNYARHHRSDGTKGEAVLWRYALSMKQTGYQFNRQYSLDKYIVDFICRKLKLVIEVDGNSHNRKEISEKDSERHERIESLGYTIIRFSEKEVQSRLDDVVKEIYDVIYALEQD